MHNTHVYVVCGQVVRRAEEQVDSVIDQWMSCWKSRNTLVFVCTPPPRCAKHWQAWPDPVFPALMLVQ